MHAAETAVPSDTVFEGTEVETAGGESEQLLRALGNVSRSAFILLDDQARITFWNPAAERIFGYCSSEAVGQTLQTLLAPTGHHGASSHEDTIQNNSSPTGWLRSDSSQERWNPSGEDPPSEALPERLPGLDICAGLTLTAGNVASYRNGVIEVSHSQVDQVGALWKALVRGDLPQARSAAHDIKTGAMAIGAIALRNVACSMERASAEGDTPLVRQLFPVLEKQVAEVMAAATLLGQRAPGPAPMAPLPLTDEAPPGPGERHTGESSSPRQRDAEVLPDLLPHFNIPAALLRINGNTQLLIKLILMFCDSYASAGQELRQQVAEKRYEDAQRLAHTLTGTAGALEAAELRAAAAAIEYALRNDRIEETVLLIGDLERVLAPALIAAASLNSLTAPAPQPRSLADGCDIVATLVILREQIATNNTKARKLFAAAHGNLMTLGEETLVEELGRKLDRLDFPGALPFLDQLSARVCEMTNRVEI